MSRTLHRLWSSPLTWCICWERPAVRNIAKPPVSLISVADSHPTRCTLVDGPRPSLFYVNNWMSGFRSLVDLLEVVWHEDPSINKPVSSENQRMPWFGQNQSASLNAVRLKGIRMTMTQELHRTTQLRSQTRWYWLQLVADGCSVGSFPRSWCSSTVSVMASETLGWSASPHGYILCWTVWESCRQLLVWSSGSTLDRKKSETQKTQLINLSKFNL